MIGVVITIPLLLMLLSGTALLFQDQIDALLNPGWRDTPVPRDALGKPQQPLDPLTLRERAERAAPPGGEVRRALLSPQPGRAQRYFIGRDAAKPGVALPFDELLLDPVTGEVVGQRRWGASPWSSRTLMSWTYKLHSSLTLPFAVGRAFLSGLALLWIAHILSGIWLALRGPPRQQVVDRSSWKWHRRIGLTFAWLSLTWAWSAVLLTDRVRLWQPVMRSIASDALPPSPQLPILAPMPLLDAGGHPDWPRALARAEAAMATVCGMASIGNWQPQSLSWHADRAEYVLEGRSAEDWHVRRGRTSLALEASEGQVVRVDYPARRSPIERVAEFLSALHRGELAGGSAWLLALFCAGANFVMIKSGLALARRPKVRTRPARDSNR
jgi:uncharacterized iron-regulated membrane protein